MALKANLIPPPLAFKEAAEPELENAQLRRNLYKATHTTRDERAEVVSELPDWEALREAGRTSKAETMWHLNVYLEGLERAVTDAGGHVLRARGPKEAQSVVTRLIKGTCTEEIIKVKRA